MLRKKSSLRKNSGNAKKKSADAGNANAVRRRGGRKSGRSWNGLSKPRQEIRIWKAGFWWQM